MNGYCSGGVIFTRNEEQTRKKNLTCSRRLQIEITKIEREQQKWLKQHSVKMKRIEGSVQDEVATKEILENSKGTFVTVETEARQILEKPSRDIKFRQDKTWSFNNKWSFNKIKHEVSTTHEVSTR